ncbi:MAG: signal peptidase I [Bacteroidales bacterium]|nr:signal peptidase I [Bacteroidales bacterium]
MSRKKHLRTKSKFLNWILDWVDAILFAVVVVTLINIFFFQAFKIPSSSMESSLYTGDHLFVSKLTYGPKMPQTPLTIPFTHNVIGRHESYSTAVQWKYRRLPGFRQVRKGDYVVFNFPNGDTVLVNAPQQDYHALVRMFGRDYVKANMGGIVTRPKDKKDHYVKRCVATPGDTLQVKQGLVWVNGEQQEVYPGVQLTYRVLTTGQRINSKVLDKMGIDHQEIAYDPSLPGYPAMPLTAGMLAELEKLSTVAGIVPNLEIPCDDPVQELELFPFVKTGWTRDEYGPVWIPKKGVTVELNEGNLPFYERLISDYEDSDVQKALAEGSYTFKQDYYFMMGDNRHNSLDSRYWGFVPEDHIVGRPTVIWLSTDKGKSFPKNIRWRRFLKFV